MNIRSKVFGGGSTPEAPILQGKKPKGVKPEALDSIPVTREEIRTVNSRFDDRHRLVQEQVRVSREGASHEVALINVSGGGAMVVGALDLKLWDKVELNLGEDGTIECAVRWIRADRFGLEFAHETRIDCGADEQAAILREVIRRSFPDADFEAAEQAPQHEGPEGRGERRHPLVWSGLLHHDHQSTSVRVRNISPTGAMIECAAPLSVGSEPLLELSDTLSISATVAWVVGDQAGLQFHTRFNLYDLAKSRPEVTPTNWKPPAYLGGAGAGSPWDEQWQRMSLGELKQELEGFLKR